MHRGWKAGLAILLAVPTAFAERAVAGGRGGFGSSGGFLSVPGRHGIARTRILQRPGLGQNGVRDGIFPWWGLPWFGDWGYWPEQGQQAPAAPVVMVVPYAAPAPAEAYKPEKAEPVTHEYKVEGNAAPATFAIALKDGTIRAADAVWVNAGGLHFITPEGTTTRVSIDAVDRGRTKSLNQAKNLQLWLPPAAE